MKTLQSKNYTDPIVYEEGFFKNEQEEALFMDELQKRVETAVDKNEAIKKGTVPTMRFSLNE